jgi:two-component system, sensor histidine kinase and response regulator
MASVSHELRTPLNGIINMIDAAITNSDKQNVTEDCLIPALNSSRLLLSIINDILDYSMLNANKLRLTFTKFNLRNACLDCLQIIENQANKNGIKISFDYKKGTPYEVISEPNRLKQILLNLLGNALKFTLKGSVNLDVYVDSDHPRLINFSVHDTGIGISIEEKNRIEKLMNDEDYHTKVNKIYKFFSF